MGVKLLEHFRFNRFMTGYVYLVRKEDVYMIGSASNIKKQLKKIRPDEIIKTIKLDNPSNYQARLLRRYRNSRLPESGYFRFTDKQLSDCKKQFGKKSAIPKTLAAEFNIALTGSILLFLITSFSIFKIRVLPLFALSVGLGIASLPMWLLFSLGNFGGYDCDDLRLFSSWVNRVKALFMASLMSILSYLSLHTHIS